MASLTTQSNNNLTTPLLDTGINDDVENGSDNDENADYSTDLVQIGVEVMKENRYSRFISKIKKMMVEL